MCHIIIIVSNNKTAIIFYCRISWKLKEDYTLFVLVRFGKVGPS